jgi:hypothetical protein
METGENYSKIPPLVIKQNRLKAILFEQFLIDYNRN